jgi:uncharacterized membrane-anchored protein
MELTIYIALISALAGGIAAYLKKDYFSRGFFICLFTGFIGLIAIILSPKSKAKEGDEADYHGWPQYGAYAVIFIMFWSLVLLVISLIV